MLINGAHLSILNLCPYVVFVLYLVQVLLISYLVPGMHTSLLGLNNECGHPESRAGLAAV